MKPITAPVRAFVVGAALLGFVACDGPSSPGVTGLSGSAAGAANADKGADPGTACPGQSGGDCSMTVSVLLAASGKATLIVRTGTYNDATGVQTPNGTFDKVQWKIYDANGKLISTKNDNASGTVYSTPLPSNFKPSYSVNVQANIDGQSGKKGEAVVSATATPVYAPDIKLSGKTIDLLSGGQRSSSAFVLANAVDTFVVDIANLTNSNGGVSTTGISLQCLVSVDGVAAGLSTQPNGGDDDDDHDGGGRGNDHHGPPTPPGNHVVSPPFAFVGNSALYVGPGQTRQCSFALSLPVGPHTITVTALATDVFAGLDGSSNSTTANVVAGTPADVSITRIERLVTGSAAVPGPTFGAVPAASAQTFAIWVTSPPNSIPVDATCDATIVGAATGTYQLAWVAKTVHVSGNTQECSFTLTVQNPGTVTINATVTSAGDPVLTNNTATGTLIINPTAPPNVTTDLIARSITPVAPIVSGAGPVTYTAAIGVLAGGTNPSANFTCAVTATRASGVGTPAVVTVLPATGPATTTTDGQCHFTLGGLTDNNGQNETYDISVTATPTDANELAAANNTVTADQIVQPKSIDVFVRSILQQIGTTTQPVGQVAGGSTAQYVAAIGATGGNQTSSAVTCIATAINLRTKVSTTLPTTVSGPASPGTDALCTFSATLAGNGNVDENYQLVVTAQPTGIVDVTLANNTLTASVTAIIRVDVSVTNVQMTVGGVLQTILGTIAKGKTGNYTVTFTNGSSRAATITCVVTAAPGGGVAVPVPVTTVNPITIPANGTNTCAFTYAFPQLVAVDFVATAANVVPVDQDLSNNSYGFETVSTSDHTFPAITAANVAAHQAWVTNPSGTVTELDAQATSLNRITLTFAQATSIIGDFKLTGIITTGADTGATPYSRATWTVKGLKPGVGGNANCVIGVDAGATSVTPQNISLSICAQQIPGDSTTQAIFIEYNSSAVIPQPAGKVLSPPPTAMFGPSLTFNVTLDWTLQGATVSDEASAVLLFNLNTVNNGTFPAGTSWVADQTGLVTVIRNGGA